MHGHNATGDSPTGAPSVSSALEHLVAGSQGVITKRIDLALLEGHELLSRTLQRAALGLACIALATAAWFAGAACLVLFVTPDASWAVRLATFGLLNGGCALGLAALAKHRGRPQTPEPRNGSAPSPTG